MKRLGYLVLGFISLLLGLMGALIPILPTVPFLMLSSFCFLRSSEKLHLWFTQTKLYKNNLKSFVEKRGMSVKVKCRTIILFTLIMIIAFISMKNIKIAQIIIFIIWVSHIFYFVFGVKTIQDN